MQRNDSLCRRHFVRWLIKKLTQSAESGDSARPRLGADSSSFPIPLSELSQFGADAEILDISVAAKSPTTTGSLSQKQVEYFIATQVNLLVHNETKALPPKQLQVLFLNC